ncbi:MAG: aldehyde dehydrogenase family protein [Tolypothrix carrinoi HA7290-LM1]|jgi:hypothetical protein|nr:aldehyde dehydrogenase family protein [Tolypothrix carrinoi HA7290-LM1]
MQPAPNVEQQTTTCQCDTAICDRIGAEIFDEARLPAGVYNMITRPGGRVGDQLVKHPAINNFAALQVQQKSGLASFATVLIR